MGRYGLSVRDFGEVQDAPVFSHPGGYWYVGLCGCCIQPGRLLAGMTQSLS